MISTTQALITGTIRHPPSLVLIQNNLTQLNHNHNSKSNNRNNNGTTTLILTHYLQIWIANKQTPTVVCFVSFDTNVLAMNQVKNSQHKPCFFIDCFSDPMKWNNTNTESNAVNNNNSIFTSSHQIQLDLTQINSFITEIYNKNQSKIPTTKDFGIIIDNLNILFLYYDPFEVILFLKQLSKQYSVVGFYNSKALLNSESFKKSDLLNMLSFIAETFVEILDPNEGEPEDDDVLTQTNNNLCILNLISKKKSGRINKEAVYARHKPEESTLQPSTSSSGGGGASAEKSGFLVFRKVKKLKDKAEILEQQQQQESIKNAKKGSLTKKQKEEQDQKKKEAEEKAKKKMEEELGNLTFKLSLTEEETKARKSVVLPYIHYGENELDNLEPTPNDSDDLDDFDDDEEPDSD